jgi:hypothetical protein
MLWKAIAEVRDLRDDGLRDALIERTSDAEGRLEEVLETDHAARVAEFERRIAALEKERDELFSRAQVCEALNASYSDLLAGARITCAA